jgi:hypothetical protein
MALDAFKNEATRGFLERQMGFRVSHSTFSLQTLHLAGRRYKQEALGLKMRLDLA